MTVREELADTLVARRLEIAARGEFTAGGGLRLDVSRATYERRDGKGAVRVVTTGVVAADPKTQSAADVAATCLLEALRGSEIRIDLDAANGVTSVEGIDRALDAAVAADASLANERASLRDVCSDAAWRRGLVAAGLCAVPRAGDPQRSVRVRVPGFGETTMSLAGEPGGDEAGRPAYHFSGSLRSQAAFEGDPGAAPGIAGEADVAGVAGEATTSYPSRGAMPSKGEWTLTVPFTGGRIVRTTTSFELVRK